jgi:hypothetical protein
MWIVVFPSSFRSGRMVCFDDSTVSPLPKQERRIVRLRKCDGADGSEGEDVLAEREREHVWREAVFCRGVMVPLLGECYIQPPTAACMDRAEVRLLDQILRKQRPGNLLCVLSHLQLGVTEGDTGRHCRATISLTRFASDTSRQVE